MGVNLFLQLPYELQTSILQHLSSQSALSLGATCAAAYQVVQPLVYASLSIHWLPSGPPRLDLLLRTLIHSPDNRKHVNSLHLQGTVFRKGSANPIPVPALSIEALPVDAATALIQSTGASKSISNEWINQLMLGNADALVSLLFILLPKLEHLYLGPNFAVVNTIMGQLLRESLRKRDGLHSSELECFSNLSSVTVLPRPNHHRRRKEPCNAQDLLPFFYAPRLEYLCLCIDNPDTFTWPAEYPPTCDSLKSLEVYRLREQNLLALLTAANRIQKFEWHWFYITNIDHHAGDATVNLDSMTQAMTVISGSLTELVIYGGTAIATGDLEYPMIETKGHLDLSNCRKLERLRVPWFFWMDSSPFKGRFVLDGLPHSIETVTFACDLEECDTWNWDGYGRHGRVEQENKDPYAITTALISGLQKLDRETLPRLRKITVLWNFELYGSSQEQQKVLEQLSRDLQIEVVWEKSTRISLLFMPPGQD